MTADVDRLTSMVLDPEVTGEMLAVGTVLYTALNGGFATPLSIRTVNKMAFPDDLVVAGDARFCRAARVIAADSRRYRPPQPTSRCTAPMVRREGPCGKRAVTFGTNTDWATGEQYRIGACRRHEDWFWRNTRQNRRGPEVGTVPIPPANSGGVLRRHLPEFDWEKLWAGLDPQWQRHPEPDDETGQDTTGGLSLVVSNSEREQASGRNSAVTPLAVVSNKERKDTGV